MIINYLSFANALLEGGNISIQSTIYSFFMSYEKSEVIFARFNAIIRKQIRFTEFFATNKSVSDHLDVEEENKSMIELLEMVLRFL